MPGKFLHLLQASRTGLQLDVAELEQTSMSIGFGAELFGENRVPRDGERRIVDVALLARNARFRRGSDRARVSSFWVSPWPAFGGSGVRRVLGCRRR
jgi:hypothetical protein